LPEPDQQDVALRELDLVLGAAHVLEPLVVVVDRDRQRALGHVLPDHVVVQAGLDLAGHRQVGLGGLRVGAFGRHFIANDVVAQLDALVADEHAGTGDELLHLVLALAAKGAVQDLLAGSAFFVGHRGWGSGRGGRGLTNDRSKEIGAFFAKKAPFQVLLRACFSALPHQVAGGALRCVSTWSIRP
jgi:hypothetical protein